MSQDARVEQFRLEQTEELLRFLRVAYPDEPRKSEPGHWKWHYLENPNTNRDVVPLWVVSCGTEIVGQMATIPVVLQIGRSERPAIWILDFIVREDFRGKGFGKQMVRTATEKYSTLLTLGINEQSAGLFRRMGWTDLGRIHRYHKLLYAGNALNGSSNAGLLRGVLNGMSAPLRWGAKRSAPRGKYEVKTVDHVGAEFDALWNRAAGQWRCAVRRDARPLTWQFERQPGKTFEILGAYGNDGLVGYAVLFFRKSAANSCPPKAALSDLCYQREDAEEVVNLLVESALRRSIERRAGSLVTDVLDGLTEKSLQRQGFWRIKRSPQFMAWTASDAELISNPENWFLTRGDSDVSIIEQPNLEEVPAPR